MRVSRFVNILYYCKDILLYTSKIKFTIQAKCQCQNEVIKINIDQLQNIEIGKTYKNYKNMCDVLQEPIKNGKSKTYQMKEWKRYFNFEKVGQKFLVTEIYQVPLKNEDLRNKGNNSIYVQYIELLLLNQLAKEPNWRCALTKQKLFEILGLTNKKYKEKPYKELMEFNSSIKTFDINHFYQRANQKLEQILFGALKNLKNRCLISYSEQIVIVDQNNETKIASDKEIKLINSIYKQVLNEMKYISLTQVFLKFKGDDFYNRVNEILYERYKWQYTYKQYKLIYTKEDVIQEIPNVEARITKLQLNDKVINVMNLQANKKYNDNQSKLKEEINKYLGSDKVWGDVSESIVDKKQLNLFVYKDNYVEIQKELAEYLLRIN